MSLVELLFLLSLEKSFGINENDKVDLYILENQYIVIQKKESSN